MFNINFYSLLLNLLRIVTVLRQKLRPLVCFRMFFHYNINFNIISNILPGIPSIPTNIAVTMFKPIWKLNTPPTRFIKYINIPPNIELNTNFSIVFIGNINNFPNITKNAIHAKYVIIVLVSNFIPPFIT